MGEIKKKPRKVAAISGVAAEGTLQADSDSAKPKPVTTITCEVNGKVQANITPDSGAEVSVVTPGLIKRLESNGVWLQLKTLEDPVHIRGVGPTVMQVQRVKLDLRFDASSGQLLLRNVVCWVLESDLSITSC